MSRVPGRANVASFAFRLGLRLALFAGVAVCALFAGPAWAGVIYLKADASGANNGTSWADAYTGLQAALAAAQPGDEIWAAQGIYKPTAGTDRTVSFVLRSGVALYGGFAGSETDRAQRNWTTNPTILSGDIATTATTDNTHHVVVGADLAVLDGFTITNGNADSAGPFGRGGGMYNENCSPTVSNCTFSDNMSYYSGGGMDNEHSSPTVTNCTLNNNSNCGIYSYANSSPTVTSCTFAGNLVAGMRNYGGSPNITGSTFSNNLGRGMWNSYSSATVTNCTFSNNSSGGMNNDDCSPVVTNCTFIANSAGPAGTMMNRGGGMCNNTRCSATVTNCVFVGNVASTGGGMFNFYSLPTVTNCTFSGNTASRHGGGMKNDSSSPKVTNCVFSSNTAVSGGGAMENNDSSPIVTNCTFTANTADYGGGMYNYSGSPSAANCIFWSNSDSLNAEISNSTGVPNLRYCLIKGCGGSGPLWNPALGVDGGGNLDADPRFVSPASPAGPDGLWRTRDDGLRLLSESPCIGAADSVAAPLTDILGLARGTGPDIGAYEFYPFLPARANPAWQLFE